MCHRRFQEGDSMSYGLISPTQQVTSKCAFEYQISNLSASTYKGNNVYFPISDMYKSIITNLNNVKSQALTYVPKYLELMPNLYTTAIGLPYMYPDFSQVGNSAVMGAWQSFEQYVQLTFGDKWNSIVLAAITDIYNYLNSNITMADWKVWKIEIVDIGIVPSPIVNNLYLIDSIDFIIYMIPVKTNPAPLSFQSTGTGLGTGLIVAIVILAIIAAYITTLIVGAINPKVVSSIWGNIPAILNSATWLVVAIAGVFLLYIIYMHYSGDKT
jgi:hypothetical protein